MREWSKEKQEERNDKNFNARMQWKNGTSDLRLGKTNDTGGDRSRD